VHESFLKDFAEISKKNSNEEIAFDEVREFREKYAQQYDLCKNLERIEYKGTFEIFDRIV